MLERELPPRFTRFEKNDLTRCTYFFTQETVIGVLSREVALGAMVLTNSLHGVSQSDVGKEPRHDRYMSFRADGPKAHLKPSQHACLFRGYLRVNHRTSVLSTVPPPLFASQACDTVEMGFIESSKRHAKYIMCYLTSSLGGSQEKSQMRHKTWISVRIISCIQTYQCGLLMRRIVRV